MADQSDRMGVFNRLKSGKAPIKRYNTYRGLPFSHSADILCEIELEYHSMCRENIRQG